MLRSQKNVPSRAPFLSQRFGTETRTTITAKCGRWRSRVWFTAHLSFFGLTSQIALRDARQNSRFRPHAMMLQVFLAGLTWISVLLMPGLPFLASNRSTRSRQ